MATKEKEQITKTYTIDETVEVRPIPRSNSLYETPIALHTGASVKFDLPMDPVRKARNPVFEDKDEQAFFEKELNLPVGALSIYDRKNKFWDEYVVTISHEGIVLDLNNVADLLKFKVLKANSHKIAESWSKRNDDGRFRFAFVKKGAEDVEVNKTSTKKQKAYVFLSNIEDSNDMMIDVLNVLGKRIDRLKGASSDFLKAQLYNLIEETNPVGGDLSGLDKIVEIASDKDFEYRVLIDKALQARAIARMNKNGYRLFKGDEEIAEDTKEMIEWLKNPKNQVKVEAIRAQIETYFK